MGLSTLLDVKVTANLMLVWKRMLEIDYVCYAFNPFPRTWYVDELATRGECQSIDYVGQCMSMLVCIVVYKCIAIILKTWVWMLGVNENPFCPCTYSNYKQPSVYIIDVLLLKIIYCFKYWLALLQCVFLTQP